MGAGDERSRSRKRNAAVALAAALSMTFLAVTRDLRTSLASTSAASRSLGDDNPHFWKYSYVIVTYHKAGHQLSKSLRGHLQNHITAYGGKRKLRRNIVSPREDFDPVTKCSDLSFGPGTVTIIEAPEFHCAEGRLADMLMRNPYSKRPKWGVKIIHLVRDPFSMAVSNYHYHSQDPTPEPYVHWKDPCTLANEHTGPLADLVAPLLSDPAGGMLPAALPDDDGGLPAREPVMTRRDFDNIIDDCRSLYRTRPGLANATYYEHLRALDPAEGLRMSTADKFGHIALMASDLIMLSRVQRLERYRSSGHPERRRQLDIITMPMQDWIDRPRLSMRAFLDFIFRHHMPDYRKNSISRRYERGFGSKRRGSSHITTGKFDDTEELAEGLRRDPVFGGPLARIEALVDNVLRLQSAQQ